MDSSLRQQLPVGIGPQLPFLGSFEDWSGFGLRHFLVDAQDQRLPRLFGQGRPGGGSLPYGIVADDNWVHILAEPGIYVRRRVPPVLRATRREGQTVVLEWRGRGTLQSSTDVIGLWPDLPDATSPHSISADSLVRFFRAVAR